jgi:hypothetical protein
MRRVFVTIDRLVLGGVPREAAVNVAEGLRAELHRQLMSPDLADALGASRRIPGTGRAVIPAPPSPEAMGAGMARRIVRRLRG